MRFRATAAQRSGAAGVAADRLDDRLGAGEEGIGEKPRLGRHAALGVELVELVEQRRLLGLGVDRYYVHASPFRGRLMDSPPRAGGVPSSG